MSRRVAVLLVVLASAGGPISAQKGQLLSKLKAEFEKKSFVTRITFGSHIMARLRSTGQTLPRLVDTESYPDGTLKYYVCRGYVGSTQLTDLLDGGFYTPIESVSHVLKSGTQVWVAKVDLKDDRIELLLTRDANRLTAETYAKLKVMSGKGYQSKDYETIVGAIARSLRVERFERLYALNDEYDRLKRDYETAEREYHAAGTDQPKARRVAAERLAQVCRALAANRGQYAALGKAETESGGLASRAQELDAEVRQLEVAEAAARLTELQQRGAELKGAAVKHEKALRGMEVTSEDTWQRKAEALRGYGEALASLDTIYQQLGAAGNPPPPADAQWLLDQRRSLERMREVLGTDRGKLALNALDARYREMERKRTQLQDAYVKAFGTNQERPSLEVLASHLEEMYQNRAAAARAGNKRAATQAEALARDIKKLR